MTVQDNRFNKNAAYQFGEIVRFITKSDEILPEYKADTRKRDKALQTLWRSENLLSSVVSGAVSRDKNRGWYLTGVARQVAYYSKRLHTCHNNIGWRQFVSMNSTAWYTTNMGYASEIGFRYEDGPAETMYSFDSTKLRLTNNPLKPLIYYPRNGSEIYLKRNEYIHGNSMPSFEEAMNYAGFCAIERCIIFSKIMIGVNQNHLEKLGVVLPKGILFGTGIKRNEWMQAVADYQADKKSKGTSSYDGVMGFFASQPEAKLSLMALSELPDNFSLKEFVDVLMQAYSVAFGFPVGEFWSIESGSFGRTGEMNVQQQQAYAKGEMDFALSFQEQLQTYFLPPSLSFTFESRNDEGHALKSEIDAKRAAIIVDLYTKTPKQSNGGFGDKPSPGDEIDRAANEEENQGTQGLITREEGRQLLVEWGIVPKSISSDVDGDEQITDLQEARYAARNNYHIRRMAEKYPNEPIVSYRWGETLEKTGLVYADRRRIDLGEYDFYPGSITVLYEKGKQMWD